MSARKERKEKTVPWHEATALVHGGTLRSQFGETSEAIFLNSGYVYDTAEQAEARFKGDEEGFVYSRYARPPARRPRAALRAAWPPSPRRFSVISRLATMSSRRGRCSAAAAISSRTFCRGSASQRR